MERWGLAAFPRPSQPKWPCCDQSLSTFLHPGAVDCSRVLPGANHETRVPAMAGKVTMGERGVPSATSLGLASSSPAF